MLLFHIDPSINCLHFYCISAVCKEEVKTFVDGVEISTEQLVKWLHIKNHPQSCGLIRRSLPVTVAVPFKLILN